MNRALIAAAVGALALTGCATYSATPAQTPGEAPPTEPAAILWPATPYDCSTLAGEADKPAELPDGAGRVTLCNEPGHEIHQLPPPDALVDDPAAVVAAYNAGEHANLAAMACTADLGPAYRLVIEYPEGEVVQLRGELYGCRVVGDKLGAQDVLDVFATVLRTQRETQPVVVDDPLAGASCTSLLGSGSWLPALMSDTIAGFRCTGDASEPTVIRDADWATLRDDHTARVEPGNRTEAEITACEQTVGDVLTGVNAAGERVALHGMCGVFEGWSDGQAWVWRPGPEASELLGLGG